MSSGSSRALRDVVSATEHGPRADWTGAGRGPTGRRHRRRALPAAVDLHGAAFVATWSVVRIPRRGDWTTIAEGQALVEHAVAGSAAKNGRTRPARRPAVSA